MQATPHNSLPHLISPYPTPPALETQGDNKHHIQDGGTAVMAYQSGQMHFPVKCTFGIRHVTLHEQPMALKHRMISERYTDHFPPGGAVEQNVTVLLKIWRLLFLTDLLKCYLE